MCRPEAHSEYLKEVGESIKKGYNYIYYDILIDYGKYMYIYLNKIIFIKSIRYLID